MLECYGKALFDLALEENKLHDVKEEFYTFRKIFKYDPELQKFMKSKIIDKKDKKDMLDVALKDFSWITKNFFKVLIDNNQIENLLEIYIEFIEFYQEKNNIRFFEVYSAEELSEKEIQMISNKLQRIYSSTIEIKTFVDESLIGGLRINHNGVALDNTLLNQLEILKAIL